MFSGVSAVGYQSWLNTGLGKSGVGLSYIITKGDARIEFYFNSSDGELNLERYNYLFTKKHEIERDYGEPLSWDYKEGRKQTCIKAFIKIGGLDDEDKWAEIQDEMIDKTIRLEKAVRPYINDLP